MVDLRRARCLALPVLVAPMLSGCFFVFIPGALIQKVSDGITGAEGEHCIGRNAKVGDLLKSDDGKIFKVLSVSGTSTRCNNPERPIRAALALQT